jgi:hypothetical protein
MLARGVITFVFTFIAVTPSLAQYCDRWADVSRGVSIPASGVALAYDSLRHETVRLGGDSEANVTRAWNGNGWALRATGDPGPTYAGAMAFDAARGVTVLFGGSSGGSGNERRETWLWNGTAWTLQTVGTVPAARVFHAMAYDSTRQVIVLFGGHYSVPPPQTFPEYLGDTWEWNGTAWSLRSSTGPSPRSSASMAYDAGRQVTVLFGGIHVSVLGETWEWNGTSWSLRATTGPAATYGNTMFYDSARERVVMYDGHDEQTWVWDGDAATWSSLISGPPERVSSNVAYDEDRGIAVLVGGFHYDPNFTYGDTWEFSTLQLPGDLDHSGVVELADLAVLLAHFGTQSGATYEDGDLDADGDVDLADLASMLAHFGTACP